MSNTPRTDGLWVALMDSLLHCGIHPSTANSVFQKMRDFRQLETELAAATTRLAEIEKAAGMPEKPHGFPVTSGVVSLDFDVVQRYAIALQKHALHLAANKERQT